jgi:type VI secretion system protein ImpJ
MFLTPQQFQTQDQDQFFESALQFRFNASCFANYGVTDLDIDSEALQNGLFRLATCKGIMPDGEPFDMPDADELPASRAVATHFAPAQESLDIFLAIPENRPRARNVTIPGKTQPQDTGAPPPTRYLAETRMLPDENTGDDEKPVQVARRTFRILFGDEYGDGFSMLRIAQVIRNAAGMPILNPRFVAPCLSLASSSYLNSLLRRQIEILAAKSGTLSGQRRQRGKITAEFSPSETANLHTVNSYLPELKHFWKVHSGHPEPAYVAATS